MQKTVFRRRWADATGLRLQVLGGALRPGAAQQYCALCRDGVGLLREGQPESGRDSTVQLDKTADRPRALRGISQGPPGGPAGRLKTGAGKKCCQPSPGGGGVQGGESCLADELANTRKQANKPKSSSKFEVNLQFHPKMVSFGHFDPIFKDLRLEHSFQSSRASDQAFA